MSNTQTKTDLLIKEKLENLAPVPPNKLWNAIQAGIIAIQESLKINDELNPLSDFEPIKKKHVIVPTDQVSE